MSAIQNFYLKNGFAAVVAVGGVIIFVIMLLLNAIAPALYDDVVMNTALVTEFNYFIRHPWTFFTYPLGMGVSGNFIFISLLEILIFYQFANIHKQFYGEDRSRRLVIFAWLVAPLVVFVPAALIPLNQAPLLLGFNTLALVMLGAAITIAPNLPVRLYGLIELKLWMLGAFMILIEAASYKLVKSSMGINAMISPAIGFLYVYFMRRGTDLTAWLTFDWLKRKKSKPVKSAIRVVHSQPSLDASEVDRILDKINEVGYDGLTRQEKETLARYSRGEDDKKPPGGI